MLEISDVTFRYADATALDGINMVVDAGRIIALLGPNGAGKSTLVSLVAGHLVPQRGWIKFNTHRFVPTSGVAAQDVALYPGLSVRDNLRFFTELSLLSRSSAEAAINQVSLELAFDHLLDRPVARLSGGEQRLVHVATALICHSGLLVLDEPTAGLDVEVRHRLLAAIKQRAEEGATILYTTHYLPEVEELDAIVAVLSSGRVIACGPVGQIISEYSTSFVELTFDGEPPDLDLKIASRSGGRILVELNAGRIGLPTLIHKLGSSAARLSAVNVIPPNLDSALITLTGRRYCDL